MTSRVDPLTPGAIVRYPYPWHRQAEDGETEGRKPRPTCVVLAVKNPKDGLTHIAILAITSQPPIAGRRVIEIPETELRRGGLKDWQRAWIAIDEFNYDVVERSYYFEPAQEVVGRFGKPFVQRLALAILPAFQSGRGRVDRID